jgi:thioredoxin reductase (NADPH)
MERGMSDVLEGAVCGIEECAAAASDHFGPATGAKATLAIEVISDAICPWCWVAKRRLGRAITAIAPDVTTSVTQDINGADLAERARQQAVKFGVELLMMQEGVKSTFHDNRIWTDLADGGTMVARANICATGVEWRRLNLPNEGELLGRGLYYGAGASEAPLCGGEDVYVVGGGNSAGQAVMHLAKHAKSVTMLVRDKALAASMSQYLSDRILGAANVQVQYDVEITGLDGENALERIRIGSRTTKEAEWAATPRLFVAIGGVPNTDWAADTAIVRDQGGYLVTGPDLLTNGKAPASWPLGRAPYYLETTVPGSFAAGDVRHRSIKRVATAAGEGAMAIAFVHRYLEETA